MILNKKMYKENTKYKLIGYRPVGFMIDTPRTEIAEWKKGSWYPYGCGKRLCNFVIKEIVEI